MRTMRALPAFLLAAGVLAACGTADSQEQWSDAIQDAGIEIQGDATAEELFEQAEMYCDLDSRDTIAEMASRMLADDSETHLSVSGADPATAAQSYAEATWEHACE